MELTRARASAGTRVRQQNTVIRVDGINAGAFRVTFDGPAEFSENIDRDQFAPTGTNTAEDSLVVDPGDLPSEFNKDWTRGPTPAECCVISGGPLRFVVNPAGKDDIQGDMAFELGSGECRTVSGQANGGAPGEAGLGGGLLLLLLLLVVVFFFLRGRGD